MQLLHDARIRAGLSLRRAAAKAGTSHATLVAYEKGRKSPSVATYIRLLYAYGYAADVNLCRRIREVNGYARGDELEAALELAAEFPVRTTHDLEYPLFGRDR